MMARNFNGLFALTEWHSAAQRLFSDHVFPAVLVLYTLQPRAAAFPSSTLEVPKAEAFI